LTTKVKSVVQEDGGEGGRNVPSEEFGNTRWL